MSARQRGAVEPTWAALAETSQLFHPRRDVAALRHLFAGVLMALFVLTVLLALAAGVAAYGGIVANGGEQDTERLATALIANTLTSNDYAGALAREEGPEGPALVLTQRLETGSYQTRLYLFEGSLVQDYVLAGAAYDPRLGEELFATKTFSFSADGSLVTVTTDAGTVCVDLRAAQASTEGGA